MAESTSRWKYGEWKYGELKAKEMRVGNKIRFSVFAMAAILGMVGAVVGCAVDEETESATDESSLDAPVGPDTTDDNEADSEGVDEAAESEPADDESGPPKEGSLGNPVPVGTGWRLNPDDNVWTLTVTGSGSVIGEFDDGRVAYVVPVSATLGEPSAGEVEPASLWLSTSFSMAGPVSRTIIDFESTCGIASLETGDFDFPDEYDDNWTDNEVLPGGSVEGPLCYAMSPEDAGAGPLLYIEETFDFGDDQEHWFATSEGDQPDLTQTEFEVPMENPEGVGSLDNPVPVGTPWRINPDDNVWAFAVISSGSVVGEFSDGRVAYAAPVWATLGEPSAGEAGPASIWLSTRFSMAGPVTNAIFDSDSDCTSAAFETDNFDMLSEVSHGWTLNEVLPGGSVAGLLCYAMSVEDAEAGPLLHIEEMWDFGDDQDHWFATS